VGLSNLKISLNQILLVDDSEFVGDLLTMVFRRYGVSLICAQNPQVCNALLNENPFQYRAIIMDIDLGNGLHEGLELAQEIQLRNKTPIVFFTGCEEACIVEKAKRISGNKLIPKNGDIGKLIQILFQVMTNDLLQYFSYIVSCQRKFIYKYDSIFKKGMVCMKRFTWDASYETGDSVIDEQHKNLFRIGSEFNAAILAGGNSILATKLIEELATYAVHHFKCEEDWMEKSNYPQLDIHRALHESLKREVAQRIIGIKNGKMPLNAELSIFIHGWIAHHIMDQDVIAIHWCKDHDLSA